jgi:hypothetical protein
VIVAAAGACLALALVIAWALNGEARGDDAATDSPFPDAPSEDVRVEVESSDLEPAAVESRRAEAVRVEPKPAKRASRGITREQSAVRRTDRATSFPGKLRVHVVDEYGRALAGLTGKIRLERTAPQGEWTGAAPYRREASVPADGVLVFEQLALGAWSIVVDLRDREAGASTELTPAAPERDVEVVLRPWRVLRVRLCEPSGAPFAAALEREFPGHSVMLALELNDPSANSLEPATEPMSPGSRNRLAGKLDEVRAQEIARSREELDRVLQSDALRFRVVGSGTRDDAPWRTLSVNSFGALALDVRFGKVVVAHGEIPAGVQDVTLTATLDSFRDVLRTLRVKIVDEVTERPVPGVSVRLRWSGVETTPPRFTDGNGAVTFESQLPRTVAVDVVPEDYNSASEPVEIVSDADSSVTVRVRRAGAKPVEGSGGRPDGQGFPRH